MCSRGFPSYIVVYILFLGGIFSYIKGIDFMVIHAPDLIPSSNIECTLREIGLHSQNMLTLEQSIANRPTLSTKLNPTLHSSSINLLNFTRSPMSASVPLPQRCWPTPRSISNMHEFSLAVRQNRARAFILGSILKYQQQ